MAAPNARPADEMAEILARVRAWAGGEAQAITWYQSQPIPSLGGSTAEALVNSGRAAAVGNHLDRITLGEFA